jgi:hypothetical protein
MPTPRLEKSGLYREEVVGGEGVAPKAQGARRLTCAPLRGDIV